MRVPQSTRTGFTLLELLIGLSLMSVILSGVFLFWSNVSQGRDRISTRIDRTHAARTLIDRLETYIPASIVGDGLYHAGIVGDESHLSLLVRGVALQDATSSREEIGLTDLQRVEFQFDEQAAVLYAGGGIASETSPAHSQLSTQIGLVRFRYHDGSEWKKQFNSWQSNRLPIAIEVAVWYDHPTGGPLEFDSDEVDSSIGLEAGLDNEAMSDEFASSINDSYNAAIENAEIDERDWPAPDRLRVIVVADGPTFGEVRSFDDNVGTQEENSGEAPE